MNEILRVHACLLIEAAWLTGRTIIVRGRGLLWLVVSLIYGVERVVELVDIVVVDVSSEGARVIHRRHHGEIDRACRRLAVVDEEDGRNCSRA